MTKKATSPAERCDAQAKNDQNWSLIATIYHQLRRNGLAHYGEVIVHTAGGRGAAARHLRIGILHSNLKKTFVEEKQKALSSIQDVDFVFYS